MWLSCALEPLEKVRLIKRPDSSRQQTGVHESRLIQWLTYTCRALGCTSWQESLSPPECTWMRCSIFPSSAGFLHIKMNLSLISHWLFLLCSCSSLTLINLSDFRGRRWRHYPGPAFWLEVADSAHLEQASEQLAYLKFFEAVIGYQCSCSRIKEALMSTHCFIMHPARFCSLSYSCFVFIQIFLGNWEKASQSLTVSL